MVLSNEETPSCVRTRAWLSPLLEMLLFFYFLKIFYLFIHERHSQREKQAPCREPDTGLDPGSPGSHPGLKAALNR